MKLSRRMLLRGAGGALALPLLTDLDPRLAHADMPAFPKRFIVLFSPNGTIPGAWAASGSGPTFALGDIMTPLAAHQQDLIVLQNLEMSAALHSPGGDAHGLGMGCLLTGTELLAGDQFTPPDLSAFVSGGLDSYDVVFFLNTTGNVFQGDGEALHQQALQDFMEKKHGGFVGTHSATDTYDSGWQWYGDFIGANFDGHSGYEPGSAHWKSGVTHSILTTAAVPNPWARTEEWYRFKRDVSMLAGFTVLLMGSQTADAMDRPSAWVHDLPGGGRLFYTGFGHDVASFKEPAFMQMLMTGIKWAAHRG